MVSMFHPTWDKHPYWQASHLLPRWAGSLESKGSKIRQIVIDIWVRSSFMVQQIRCGILISNGSWSFIQHLENCCWCHSHVCLLRVCWFEDSKTMNQPVDHLKTMKLAMQIHCWKTHTHRHTHTHDCFTLQQSCLCHSYCGSMQGWNQIHFNFMDSQYVHDLLFAVCCWFSMYVYE